MGSAGKRIVLVGNPGPGWGNLSDRIVVRALERAGHHVRAQDAKGDYGELKKDCDLVIAAGGDGTVLGVARRLAHTPLPMVVFPVGTANNLARTIGAVADVEQLVETLRAPRERALDLGIASGSWGERFFTESVGIGWFCDALDAGLDKEDKAIDRALGRLSPLLARYEPRRWTITIDGRDASDVYTFADVMNARMLGPNLCFAPHANPFDGWLDVVLGTNQDRERVHRYVEALRSDPFAPPPALHVQRAKHVHIELGMAERIRVDGSLCPKRDAERSHFADIRVVPAAVRLWLPSG